MRRLTRAFCVAAPVLALGWSGLWVLGRDAIAERLDAGVERLRLGGLAVEIGDASIAGFPFAYAAELRDVTLADPRSGARTALPELRSEVQIATLGRLTTRLPSRFTVTLPVGPELRAALPGLPAELTVVIEAEGLEMVTEPGLDGGLGFGVSARRVAVTPETPPEALDFALTLHEIEARLGLEPPGEGGLPGAEATLAAGALAFEAEDRTDGLARRVEARLAGLDLSGAASLADLSGLARLLDGRPGADGRVTLAARDVVTRFEVDGATPAESGRVALAADALDGRAEIADGSLVARAALDGASAALRPQGNAAATGPDAPAGAIGAARLEADTVLPLAPAPRMGPIRLAATAQGIAPSADLWARLDPEGLLPRDPGQAELAIEGRARWLRPPSERGPGGEPPIAFERLALERLELAGLGAVVTGQGALDYDVPTQRPTGAVRLELSGVLGLIRRLHEAGLIAQETVQSIATLAAFYTRAGDGPDELRAEIALDGEALSVNGDRIR